MTAINDPAVVAEVTQALERYETALVQNDLDTLDALFWDSPFTVRYGATENLYGIDQIRSFRSARPTAGLARTVLRTEVTAFGDTAVAHREFERGGRRGRQTQTWVRTPQGWRVVSAHVSFLDTSSTRTG